MKEEQKKDSVSQKWMLALKKFYEDFDKFTQINEEDPNWLTALKYIVRAVGIFLLILFSPIIILVIIVVFLAV